MRAYPQLQEENIRDRALIRDWTASGLLDSEQGRQLESELRVSLRQTPHVLRAVFFVFALLVLIASAGLTLSLINFNIFGQREVLESAALALWAAIAVGLAWLLATRGRLYRCGVEEAFAAGSVGLLMLSFTWWNWTFDSVLTVCAGSLGAFAVYFLFGFRYAMVAGVVLAGMMPFSLSLPSPVLPRILSALILGLLFYRARTLRRRQRAAITGDDWAIAQVTAFAGIYLVLNVIISPPWLGYSGITSGVFYWSTYALIWIIPALGLWLGIRERDRLMIDAGSITVLATLLSNKLYLGWTRQTWDPILLGALLIGTALTLRRWLASGPGRERYGFTPERTLASGDRALIATAAISLALPQAPGAASKESPSVHPGGGESGGGGASGSF
jgi:hypothetical protein